MLKIYLTLWLEKTGHYISPYVVEKVMIFVQLFSFVTLKKQRRYCATYVVF